MWLKDRTRFELVTEPKRKAGCIEQSSNCEEFTNAALHHLHGCRADLALLISGDWS